MSLKCSCSKQESQLESVNLNRNSAIHGSVHCYTLERSIVNSSVLGQVPLSSDQLISVYTLLNLSRLFVYI
jgi:hypothetical protein